MYSFCIASRFSKICFKSIKYFKRNVSALYITGDKAHDTFSVLTPHLDFEERLIHKNDLEHNLKLRGIDENLDEIIRLWNFYKHVESKKIDLQESKFSISQSIKHLSLKGDKYAEKINTLKAHGKMVKEDLKVMKESFWSIEEKAALKILSLPNILHEKTPESDCNIIHTFQNQLNIKSKSHVDNARNLNLLEYKNPYNYFFINEAALFELCLSFYISDKLCEKEYLLFSNSDFARSVIVEGCGLNFSDPSIVFTINSEPKQGNNHLHLTGGASLSSFMAYYCRHTVFPSLFPLKHFSVSKLYHPVTSNIESLLNVAQETAVNIFIATKDYEQMNYEFEKVLQDTIEIYEKIGYHFRVCYLPAKDLKHWESLRASIQLFSNHLNDYIEVGNISLCGNYVSKRLLFNYGTGYDIKYPCIITGTLLSVPKLLSCILESDGFSKNKLLPDMLKKYIEN